MDGEVSAAMPRALGLTFARFTVLVDASVGDFPCGDRFPRKA